MLEIHKQFLYKNADKWAVLLHGYGFWCGKLNYTQKIYRAKLLSGAQALKKKRQFENKGINCMVELIPVALYINNIDKE